MFKFSEMKKEIPCFKEIYISLPVEIRLLLDKCESIPQSDKWHPEGPNEKIPHNVLAHTKIVYERARKSGDINIAVAAIFHDLGKVDTTKKNKHGSWSSHGHEFISVRIVDAHKKWIGSLGANFMRVREIVENHMKIKLMSDMRPSKQEALKALKSYDGLQIFSQCDNMKTLTDEEMKM